MSIQLELRDLGFQSIKLITSLRHQINKNRTKRKIQESRIHCGGKISMKISKYCKNQNRKYFVLKNYDCNI